MDCMAAILLTETLTSAPYRLLTYVSCLQLSNSSLLDEATAAAEAMTMCSALARGKKDKFLVSVRCYR